MRIVTQVHYQRETPSIKPLYALLQNVDLNPLGKRDTNNQFHQYIKQGSNDLFSHDKFHAMLAQIPYVREDIKDPSIKAKKDLFSRVSEAAAFWIGEAYYQKGFYPEELYPSCSISDPKEQIFANLSEMIDGAKILLDKQKIMDFARKIDLNSTDKEFIKYSGGSEYIRSCFKDILVACLEKTMFEKVIGDLNSIPKFKEWHALIESGMSKPNSLTVGEIIYEDADVKKMHEIVKKQYAFLNKYPLAATSAFHKHGYLNASNKDWQQIHSSETFVRGCYTEGLETMQNITA